MKLPSRTLPARQASGGFSLLEVIIAIAILSMGIAAIIQLYSMNLNRIQKADLYTRAIIYARSAMDETLSSSSLDETTETRDINGQFELTKSVTAIAGDDKDIADTYEIMVNVRWKGGSVVLKARKSILKSNNK